MKNETARREIESLDYYLQNHTDDYSEESHTALMMAKDALNNADVLEQISDEVNKLKKVSDGNSVYVGINDVFDIIDKYKAERG